MYHSKRIGVFISHIFGYYQRNVCQGIVDQALEYGYTTEIFTSLDGENLGTYGIGEESILRVPNYDSLDGVIFASESYPSDELKQKILERLQEMCKCPIVEITLNNNHFPTVSLENNTTTGALTDHLIDVHHYKRICYLGCSDEPFFSDKREAQYKEALRRHHLTPDAHDVCRCHYGASDALAALHFFCENGTPDAVVCYNDRLALSFMDAALHEGYRIPDDIAVTGCDDTEAGQNISPALTTVSFPVYELGTTAMKNLISIMQGQEVPPATYVRAQPLIHNSCGCCSHVDANSVFLVQKLSETIRSTEDSIFDSMNMSAALQHVTDIDDGVDLLESYVRNIAHCREFYLCLYSDWDSVSSHILQLTDAAECTENTDSILLKLAIRDGKRLPECSYQKNRLLPEYIYNSSDCAYIYTPLFFEDKEFGYIALAYDDHQISYPFRLIQMQMNMNQMLQTICEAKRTGLLVARLETLYMHDPLTGLLNKHGYNQKLDALLAHTIADQLSLCAFFADMNGLKYINDTFGHNEGDFAIQVLGHALKSVVKESDLCARFSGDEFYILCAGMTDADADDFIRRIHKYLENYNRLSSKPYDVTCSCGFAVTKPTAGFTQENIGALFDAADKMMYENKAVFHATHR